MLSYFAGCFLCLVRFLSFLMFFAVCRWHPHAGSCGQPAYFITRKMADQSPDIFVSNGESSIVTTQPSRFEIQKVNSQSIVMCKRGGVVSFLDNKLESGIPRKSIVSPRFAMNKNTFYLYIHIYTYVCISRQTVRCLRYFWTSQ